MIHLTPANIPPSANYVQSISRSGNSSLLWNLKILLCSAQPKTKPQPLNLPAESSQILLWAELSIDWCFIHSGWALTVKQLCVLSNSYVSCFLSTHITVLLHSFAPVFTGISVNIGCLYYSLVLEECLNWQSGERMAQCLRLEFQLD